MASPLGCDLPGTFCLIRGCPLFRVRLGLNESAWIRLWLEVPDSAAPDSVVTVTVSAAGQGASQVPPTHAFLQLLVLAQSSKVRCFLTPSAARAVGGALGGVDAQHSSPSPSPQDQLDAPAHTPAHSAAPVLAPASPALLPSTLVTQGRAGGGMAGKAWWGTVGGVLFLLGCTDW